MNVPKQLLALITPLGLLAARPCAQAEAVPPLDVFLVCDRTSERGAALRELLGQVGMRVRRIDPQRCAPELLRPADVVLVDWPADFPLTSSDAATPLGVLERWDRPTVFVADSGARFQQAWLLPTRQEMTGKAIGPAMQEIARQPSGLASWRQGHLLVLPAEMPLPLTDEWRTLVLATVHLAPRFISDRPVLQSPPVAGEAAEAQQQRRARVHRAMAKLDVDLRQLDELMRLPERGQDLQPAALDALMIDLVPAGPGPGTTRGNWRNWLRARRQALCWDDVSEAWRIDQLAQWCGVESAKLRGDDRSDGDKQPEAVAIAHKVVQHYGGRALADLATFSCWYGDLFFLWDRRDGWFRIENHHPLQPNVRVTPWRVALFDTAADDDVVLAEHRGPRISGRGSYRDLLERTFLPLLLLEPATSLELVRDDGERGQAILRVRLGGRCLDLRSELAVTIERSTGAIVHVEKSSNGQLRGSYRLEENTPCGPLLLPSKWRDERAPRLRYLTIEQPMWNPELPAGMATSPEQLTEPRPR